MSESGPDHDTSVAPSPRRVRAERKQRAEFRKRVVRELDLSTVGLVFPMAMLIGFFGGRGLGELFGRPVLGTWIGIGVGLLSGFYNLYKVALVLQRRAEREEEGDRGTGPAEGE